MVLVGWGASARRSSFSISMADRPSEIDSGAGGAQRVQHDAAYRAFSMLPALFDQRTAQILRAKPSMQCGGRGRPSRMEETRVLGSRIYLPCCCRPIATLLPLQSLKAPSPKLRLEACRSRSSSCVARARIHAHSIRRSLACCLLCCPGRVRRGEKGIERPRTARDEMETRGATQREMLAH